MFAENLESWHKIICSRENYVCRVCKKDFSYDYYFNERGVNQYVCGHHYPHTQKARPDLVLSLENGVPVCLVCHTKTHKGLAAIPESDELEDIPKPKDFTTQPFTHAYTTQTRFRGFEKLCKCGKFIAQQVSGVCMNCEKRSGSNFKETKGKKKK